MWTLIIILSVGNSFGAVQYVDGFASEASCLKAARQIYVANYTPGRSVSTTCVSKL
jgi:hypothetical protein